MDNAMEQQLEGLMLKNLDGIYQPNARHWLKVKREYLGGGQMADSADLVVLGAYFGKGARGGLKSVFLMGVFDEVASLWRTVCKCGNGHDDATLLRLQDELAEMMVPTCRAFDSLPPWLDVHRSVTPDFVVTDPHAAPVWEVSGAQFSRSTIHTAGGVSIRFPRVTRIREDKCPRTATSMADLQALVVASHNSD